MYRSYELIDMKDTVDSTEEILDELDHEYMERVNEGVSKLVMLGRQVIEIDCVPLCVLPESMGILLNIEIPSFVKYITTDFLRAMYKNMEYRYKTITVSGCKGLSVLVDKRHTESRNDKWMFEELRFRGIKSSEAMEIMLDLTEINSSGPAVDVNITKDIANERILLKALRLMRGSITRVMSHDLSYEQHMKRLKKTVHEAALKSAERLKEGGSCCILLMDLTDTIRRSRKEAAVLEMAKEIISKNLDGLFSIEDDKNKMEGMRVKAVMTAYKDVCEMQEGVTGAEILEKMLLTPSASSSIDIMAELINTKQIILENAGCLKIWYKDEKGKTHKLPLNIMFHENTIYCTHAGCREYMEYSEVSVKEKYTGMNRLEIAYDIDTCLYIMKNRLRHLGEWTGFVIEEAAVWFTET